MFGITRCFMVEVTLLSLLLLSSNSCFAQKDPDTLNVSLIYPMSDYRPFIERTSQTASMSIALHDGLFRVDTRGNFLPSLATAREVTHEGKHHHFTLRSDAKWSDGSRLVAEDFARGLRMLLHPDINNYLQKSWSALEGYDAYKSNPDDPSVLGINVVDDTHFSLLFTKPVPFIEFITSTPNLVPFPPAAEDPAYWQTPSAYLFSGRYMVNQPLDQFPILLENNPYYSGKEKAVYKKIYIHRHDKNKEHSRLIGDVKEGLLDVVLGMPKNSFILKDIHSDILAEYQELISSYVVLNTQKAPFTDSKIRMLFKKIINMAQAQSRVLDNAGNQFGGIYFVPKKLNGILQPSYSKDDIAESRQLLISNLKSLGYSKDNSLKLKFLTSDSGHGYGHKIGRYICGQIIDKQGILDCEVEVISSYKDYRTERKKRDYHFIIASWKLDIPYALNLLTVFTTGHSSNHALWSDAYYDQLIDSIKTEQSLAIIEKKSIEAEAYFLNQAVIMPVGANTSYLHALAVDLERPNLIDKNIIIDFVAIKRRD